jgi:hydrogenase maturation protein HypF
MSARRLRLEIQGAVQGVGFRPFVYRLAAELALCGWVINDTRGVFIEVEGPPAALETFRARVEDEPPPQARIHALRADWLEPVGYPLFEIRHSAAQGAKSALLLPDIATCSACRAEVLDPANRRAGYPFTNCTNCGPRFSIIQALPYDRPNTTMQRFIMCPTCQHEYDSPLDRRFHAQPNACPVCGPHLAFWANAAADAAAISMDVDDAAALAQTVAALLAGQIVAVKGLGGFHLMIDARNAEAIARLRERKPRPHKPLALMVRDLAQAATLCDVSPEAAALLRTAEAPIVLLPRRPDAPVAPNVAPDNPTLGLMLPYTPLHHLLLRDVGVPLVATSGNLADEPICTDEHEARRRLGHIADCFLVHNRPIERHVDDSVAWLLDGAPQLLRRARGYAPLPVLLPHALPSILAVGAHLKNTVALSVGRQIFVSQHIGDLETAEALAAFERVCADFLGLYEVAPAAIAHDLHPDYLSTHYAQQMSAPQHIAVQHHHAHLAACLAEHGVARQALGVTWDGTGYGSDGTIWGGEFLRGDAAAVERVAHLRPFRLPGGEAAVREPRRVGLALLWELYGEAVFERPDLAELPLLQSFTPAEQRTLAHLLRSGLNAPQTSSAGRLFDGVAALLGLHLRVTFEGQAAMALEYLADPAAAPEAAYQIDLQQATGAPRAFGAITLPAEVLLLDWAPLVEALLADLRRGDKPGMITTRFHNALAAAIVAVAYAVGEPCVALAGGCFQNRLLTERTAHGLRAEGFTVLLHRQVPPGDGSISLGQVAAAAAHLARQA